MADSRSLLALRVGGADLALDHGYPARIIVPGLPGVHNTKWVGRAGVPRMRARYGSSPLHLLAHLAALALAAWALLQALQLGGWERIVLWLVGAVVLHDALLWPAYTTLDRLARRGRPAGWANYVRVPVGISRAAAARLLPGHLRQGRGRRTSA